MKSSMMSASKVYAQVLVDVAGAEIENVLGELKNFRELFKTNPMMAKVFENPTLPEAEKISIIEAFAGKMQMKPLTVRFLKLIAKRNRFQILEQVFHEVDTLRLAKEGGVAGEIVSAMPLDSAQVTSITQALSKKLNKPVYLKSKVDAGLLAGMRVTVAGTTYDGTVKSKLVQLMEKFK